MFEIVISHSFFLSVLQEQECDPSAEDPHELPQMPGSY